jgi:hypothetical protein
MIFFQNFKEKLRLNQFYKIKLFNNEMPTLKRYYGGKQNNNSSSAPKAFKKGMSASTTLEEQKQPHEMFFLILRTSHKKMTSQINDISRCVIIVNKTCYLCQILCGIVIKMCYIFLAFMA